MISRVTLTGYAPSPNMWIASLATSSTDFIEKKKKNFLNRSAFVLAQSIFTGAKTKASCSLKEYESTSNESQIYSIPQLSVVRFIDVH